MQKYQRLKPNDYDIAVSYICNNCCWIHWLTPPQFNNPNFQIFCSCGQVSQIEDPDLAQFIKKADKVKTQNIEAAKNDNRERILSILEAQGFEKQNIQKALLKVEDGEFELMVKNTLEYI